MIKLTRRFKKNKKNRTFKKGGASIDVKPSEKPITKKLPKAELPKAELPKKDLPKEEEKEEKEEREGIVDIIGDKITDNASSLATFIGDAGLEIIGLERINKSEEDDESKEDDKSKEDDESKEDSELGIVGNIIDKTGAALIEDVNEVLGTVTTEEAAEKTADIIKEGAETFNKALNDPEVREELEEAIKNAGEISNVIVKSAEEPISNAVGVAANSVAKATSAGLSGAVKVGTDLAAAVPAFGAIVEAGKIINDSSKAIGAAVEAGSEAVEVASDAFIETKENVEEGLKVLDEQKKMAEQISNRTNKSIKEFENPVKIQAAGGRKTRRRLLKHRRKTKRVRFAI